MCSRVSLWALCHSHELSLHYNIGSFPGSLRRLRTTVLLQGGFLAATTPSSPLAGLWGQQEPPLQYEGHRSCPPGLSSGSRQGWL